MLLKSFRIDHVGNRVPDLLNSERGADLLSSEDYGALRQDFRQLEGIQAQQLAGGGDHWTAGREKLDTTAPTPTAALLPNLFSVRGLTLLGGDLRSSRRHELNVSQLQDPRQQLKHVSDLLLAELQHLQCLLCKEKTREATVQNRDINNESIID